MAEGPQRGVVNRNAFNDGVTFPYELRSLDFELGMQSAYDLIFDINSAMFERRLARLDDLLPGATMSGLLSEVLTETMAGPARVLTRNKYHNGHPDLIPLGRFADNKIQSGHEGVEIKSTRGGLGVDMHGARPQWLCIFRYEVDEVTEPAFERSPTRFVEVALAFLELEDFRENQRGRLGTNTASPNKNGLAKLRANRIYFDPL